MATYALHGVNVRRHARGRKRALAALGAAHSLGTHGKATWTRDELHDR